jgi:hypothetical protein
MLEVREDSGNSTGLINEKKTETVVWSCFNNKIIL